MTAFNPEDAETTENPLNRLTQAVIGAAIEVHREKGPGLLESTYESCLCHELDLRKIHHQRQVTVPLVYKGRVIDQAFRVDLIIENVLLVELKALETVLPVHRAQVLSYLRETGLPLGLLINFHVSKLIDGIHRLINKQPCSETSALSALNSAAGSIQK